MIARLIFTAFSLLAVVLAGCGDNRQRAAAVPKPAAYPRIADPGTDYRSVDSLPVDFLANASAIITRPRPDWVDISYPGLGVTLHVSVTRTTPDGIGEVIANRSERIALNVADVTSTHETSIESDSFNSVIITSPETRSTPLQFLAHDGKGLVVSGTAFFGNVSPDAPIDSLAPIVSYVSRDITHALTNLHPL